MGPTEAMPEHANSGVSPLGWWRTGVWWIVVLIVASAAWVAAFLPPVEAAERWVAGHRAALVAVAVAIAGSGLLLLVATLLLLALQGGARPATRDLTEATTGIRPMVGYRLGSGAPLHARFKGKSVAIEVQDSWTVAGMKAAGRDGQWRRDPAWQRRFIGSVAILMIVVGVLGILIVGARAWVALLFGIALIYFLVRVAWGFWRA